jgi:DNA-binding MarR family transcriptional regulator
METKPATLQSLEQTISRVTILIAELEANAFQQDGFSDLSMRQMLYMDTITQLEHPSFGELAEALGITRPSVTVLVGKLIRSGYVEKVQDGSDRRSFHIVLTGKGKQFSNMHAQMHRHLVENLIANLDGAEIEQLATLLQKAVGH